MADYPVLDGNGAVLIPASQQYGGGGGAATPQWTGWGDYADTQYTSGSPWQPTPAQWNNVPNNAGSKIETQLPLDVATFYDEAAGKILGRNGDGLSLTVEFIGKPTTATVTYLDFAFFIGGPLGPLGDGRIYQRTMSFPKGQNVERVQSFNIDGYTLNTWEANGAIFQMNPTAAVDIYKMRYLLTRTHKAR